MSEPTGPRLCATCGHWHWHGDEHPLCGLCAGRLAAAGYHIVTEGQAVVDGRVWVLHRHEIAYSGRLADGDRIYRLRPLTDEPPPPDETTSTTTTEAR